MLLIAHVGVDPGCILVACVYALAYGLIDRLGGLPGDERRDEVETLEDKAYLVEPHTRQVIFAQTTRQRWGTRRTR